MLICHIYWAWSHQHKQFLDRGGRLLPVTVSLNDWCLCTLLSVCTSILLSLLPPPHLLLPALHTPTISHPSLRPSSSPPLVSPLPSLSPSLPSFLISSLLSLFLYPSLPPSFPLSICNQALSVTVGLFVYQLQGHVFAKSEITEDETMWWSSFSLSVCLPLSFVHSHTFTHIHIFSPFFLLRLLFVFISPVQQAWVWSGPEQKNSGLASSLALALVLCNTHTHTQEHTHMDRYRHAPTHFTQKSWGRASMFIRKKNKHWETQACM